MEIRIQAGSAFLGEPGHFGYGFIWILFEAFERGCDGVAVVPGSSPKDGGGGPSHSRGFVVGVVKPGLDGALTRITACLKREYASESNLFAACFHGSKKDGEPGRSDAVQSLNHLPGWFAVENSRDSIGSDLAQSGEPMGCPGSLDPGLIHSREVDGRVANADALDEGLVEREVAGVKPFQKVGNGVGSHGLHGGLELRSWRAFQIAVIVIQGGFQPFGQRAPLVRRFRP